jgi:hypothetical protein
LVGDEGKVHFTLVAARFFVHSAHSLQAQKLMRGFSLPSSPPPPKSHLQDEQSLKEGENLCICIQHPPLHVSVSSDRVIDDRMKLTSD